MTIPPLPASPCVRVRLDYTQADGLTGGSRFYLSYSGAAPTAGDCGTLATDIGNAWSTHLAGLVNEDWTLAEVDVLDIASDSGLSGQAEPASAGANAGTALPAQCAINVEYDIARRYRGGKPRMFLPPACTGNTADPSHWSGSFVTEVNSGMVAFIDEIEALSIGAMGTLAHVNLSYYSGYNTASPPWRGPGFKYPPLYRDAAKLDTVEGYACKSMIGSQKRRRSATTA